MAPASITSIRPEDEPSSPRGFANPEVLLRSWYTLATSRQLDRARVRNARLGGERLVLYRGASGRPYAASSRCPHLGADLGHGSVVGDDLRCAMHHHCFGPDGRATLDGGGAAPPWRLRTYPVVERWGRVWVYAGSEAEFELPGPPAGSTAVHTLRLPPQRFGCHPHLIAANAFDTGHLGPLHDVELTRPARLTQAGPQRLDLDLVARFRSRRMRRLTGTEHHDISTRMSLLGGNLCFVHVSEPIPFEVLFAGQPSTDGGARTDTTLFVPRGTGVKRTVQLVTLLIALLRRDHELLDDMRFLRGFTEADSLFERVVRAVDQMPRL